MELTFHMQKYSFLESQVSLKKGKNYLVFFFNFKSKEPLEKPMLLNASICGGVVSGIDVFSLIQTQMP